MELTGMMEDQLDELYDAADALLSQLYPDYEHDMELCGEVVDAAESELKNHGYKRCYPCYVEGIRCDKALFEGKLKCGFDTCPLAK